jgi:hypothetical protein
LRNDEKSSVSPKLAKLCQILCKRYYVDFRPVYISKKVPIRTALQKILNFCPFQKPGVQRVEEGQLSGRGSTHG